jgi:hypothetical protein
MKDMHPLYELQVATITSECLQGSLKIEQLSHPKVKPHYVKKLVFFSCVHTQWLLIGFYQGFITLPLRSRVRIDSKFSKKPYK